MACQPKTGPPPQPPAARAWDVRVVEPRTDREVEVGAMLDALAGKDVVLVGETHLDDATHRLELAILEGIADRRSDKVALSLEMFERDEQEALDAYLQGKIEEASFLERATPWPNYRTGYRPLVEAAKQRGLPVVAANLPRDLQRKFAMKRKAAHSELSKKERAWMPAEILPPKPEYWTRITRQLRDHGHAGIRGPSGPEAQLYSIQNLWDNSMAAAILGARADNPGHGVVHVVGAFHVEYGYGIAAQIAARDTGASMATVTIVPVYDMADIDPTKVEPAADYVAFVPGRARGPSSGSLAVSVPHELEYRLHLPEKTGNVPLLVWLADDGERIDDVAHYWKVAVGDDAAVAVLEPLHRERQPDLRMSSRWTWPDRFGDDRSRLAMGLERLVTYVTDRYPIDPARVVVAGHREGATMALGAALASDELPAVVVALSPTDLRRVAEASLPETPPKVREVVVAPDANEAVASTFKAAGVKVRAAAAAAEATQVRWDGENLLREALGLSARAQPTDASANRRTLRIGAGSPISRQWAELHARIAEREDGVVVGVSETEGTPVPIQPDALADGKGLPLAPFSFGGTTILVLPEATNGKTKAAWRKLEEDDALKKRSRFHSLKIAERSTLVAALDALREAGKRNVLIVPAVFAATPKRMQRLSETVSGHAEGLNVAWLPGLGGELARASEP